MCSIIFSSSVGLPLTSLKAWGVTNGLFSKLSDLYSSLVAALSDFTVSSDEVTLISSAPSCIELTVRDDDMLELDEQITLSVTASLADSAVVIIAPGLDQSVITLQDDDSECDCSQFFNCPE